MVPISGIVKDVVKDKVSTGGLLQAWLWDKSHNDIGIDDTYKPKSYGAGGSPERSN